MSDERSLLVVEDDARFAETLATEFSDRGYAVETVESLAEVKRSDAARFQYAIVDLRLRTDSGLDVIADLKERAPEIRIIVLTGYGSIATAVKATKLGAMAYFTKPVDIDEVERAFHSDESEDEEIAIPDEFPSLYRHVEARVERNVIGSEHRGVVDERVVMVALAFLAAHRPAVGIRRQRVGELVFVHVQNRRHVAGDRSSQCQERGQIQHVGGQDQVRTLGGSQEAPCQRRGAAVHAPLPETIGQRQQLDFVVAVSLQAVRPGGVAAAVVWRHQKHTHGHLPAAPGSTRRGP